MHWLNLSSYKLGEMVVEGGLKKRLRLTVATMKTNLLRTGFLLTET